MYTLGFILFAALACGAAVPVEMQISDSALRAVQTPTRTNLAAAAHLGNTTTTKLGSCPWPLFKQCDGAWGSNELGTGSETICSAGCAMSSVAMYINGKGQNLNPGSMNQWLDGHGGYASGDLIIWSTVDVFGVSYQGNESPALQDVVNGINACHGLIANVRSGSHWVLLTGYLGGDQFSVNDPGFDQSSYAFGDMSTIAVYH